MAINEVVWVLVNALVSYKLTEWTCPAKECFSVLQLVDQNWPKSLGLWPNAQLHHLHYSCYQHSGSDCSSAFLLFYLPLYFSLLFYFFLHLCPSDRFDHKSIKYRVWKKVRWTVLAAHWFFNFQEVKLPLFNNSFARGIFFALGTWFTQPEFSLLDFRFADPSPYESFLHECA